MTTMAPAPAAHGGLCHVRTRLIKAHLGLVSVREDKPRTQEDQAPDGVDDKEPQG